MKKLCISILQCKSILIGYLLFFQSPQLTAQTVTNYVFAAPAGTFTALATPTATTWTGNTDEGISSLIPIGFDFWYMGTRYTNVSASTNGWLSLGTVATTATPVNNLLSGGAPRPVLAPLWDDLSIGATTNVTYKTTGTAGSQVFTLQYLNVKWPSLALGGVISFQVKLYESSGKIEYIYRPELVLALLTSGSVGITAAATGSGNFLSVNDAGTSAGSTTESNVTSRPSSGQIYRFTPPVPTAPGSLTFSGVTNSTMTLNWTDLSSNETGFVIYRSTDGVNYSFVSQTAANITSSIQTGLSVNTTYYWKVYAVTEGALSTVLSGSKTTVNYPPPPNLGTAVNFVFFTVGGAVGNTGISTITGNLGTNAGAITGLTTSTVIGSLHTANAATVQGATDVVAAYNQLNAIAATSTHGAVLGNGEILTPGVYNLPAAGSVAGVLTLDAQGDANAVFVIKVGAALTTGAGAAVSLVNGATACNVFWKAEGAITMAASTTMRGTLIANNAAASMGAGSVLEGRLFSTLGDVTFNAVSAVLPACACTPPAPIVTSPLTYCQNSTAIPLTATGTGLLWDRGAATAPTPVTTVIGATNYAVTQTAGGCLSPPANITVNVTAGPSAVIAYVNSPYRSDAGTAAVTLTGVTGGTYSSTAGLSINSTTGLINLAASTLGTYTVTYTIAASAGCNQYQTTASITIVAPPSVNLGTAANYVLFAVSGGVGNTGTSQITGNIGTNVGAITGFETSTVIGSLHTADAATAQCATDVLSAYNQLNGLAATSTHAAVLGNGETLTPGIYNLPAAGSVAGVLTLDAQGHSGELFIFKIGAALTTGAGATVNLINGASACNVYWKVEGAVTMGASTTMVGTLIANNAAASMGAGSILTGRLFSTLGAIAVGPGSASLPICPCTPAAPTVTSPVTYCQNSTAIPLTATGTNLLWGRGATTAPTPVTTAIGATNYAVTQTVGGCLSQPATITVNVTAGPSAVITYANSPYRSDAGTATVSLTGTTGGTYSSTTGLSINSVSGSVNPGASTLGTYTVTYTIAAAAGCDQYQTTTSISIIPPPSVSLGTAANFALFAVSGGVGNTGISQVTGDIGTNLGAITGFETATVVGSMHTADAVTAQGATDVLSVYNQLNAFSPTASHVAVLGNGETLFPGIYNLVAAGSAAATLTLDAQGNSNELFIFKIGGAFTTGAGTTVNLINGASACNVYWKVEGAIAMAASTTMVGTLIANNGAASMAAGGILTGRMFSTLGAVTMGPGSVTVPVCTTSGSWTGAVSTDWNTPGNWFNNSIPTATINATIPSGVPHYPVLNTGTGAVKNITIQSNASLTVTGGTLSIAGSMINNGTFDVSAGTVVLNGASSQTVPASVFAGNQIRHLTISNSAGVTLGGTLHLTGILLVSAGQLNTGGNLTLMSTAAQTALIDGSGAGEVVGNVTIQRYLASGFGYKYFSSPFQAATVGSFANVVDLNASFPNFYRYDESQVASGWITDTTAANPLTPLQGYAANTGASSVAMTVNLTGVVSNHNISSPTLYNHHQVYTQGFNLVGNPYPSPIDWNAAAGWSRTNIDNAVYYFNAGNVNQYTGTYSSYINGVSSDNVAGPVIAAMQGFFIHVTDGAYPVAASLTISNNARINNLAPVFHRVPPPTTPLIRLTAGYGDDRAPADPVVVYFDDAAKRFYDKEMDALKLMNTDSLVPSLYVLASGAPGLSIYAWPGLEDSTDVIPLGLKMDRTGWIIFNAVDIERFPDNRNIYLYDMIAGVRQDLRRNPRYRLYLNAGGYEKRFFLGFQGKSPAVPPVTGGIYTAYSVGRVLNANITEVPGEKCDVVVTNVAGQVIMRKQLVGNGHHELGSQFSSGIYIVSFYTQQQKVFAQKVFIGN